MRGKLLLIPMTLCALALTGCGQERPALAKPPADLLTCADEPVAPSLPGREEQARRDAMTLDYVLALRSAWGDCFAKVAGVRAWADALND
jgi:predicted small lipoprotein YifL